MKLILTITILSALFPKLLLAVEPSLYRVSDLDPASIVLSSENNRGKRTVIVSIWDDGLVFYRESGKLYKAQIAKDAVRKYFGSNKNLFSGRFGKHDYKSAKLPGSGNNYTRIKFEVKEKKEVTLSIIPRITSVSQFDELRNEANTQYFSDQTEYKQLLTTVKGVLAFIESELDHSPKAHTVTDRDPLFYFGYGYIPSDELFFEKVPWRNAYFSNYPNFGFAIRNKIVIAVDPESAVYKAGLRNGYELKTIDGESISEKSVLYRLWTKALSEGAKFEFVDKNGRPFRPSLLRIKRALE